MNSPAANRFRVMVGTANATSGFKKLGLGCANKRVFGEDRPANLWPCKKDHPHYRISEKNGRLYCLECEQEKARVRRECVA